MRNAILAYDLKRPSPEDNTRVKNALESYNNVKSFCRVQNVASPYFQMIVADLPDTTLSISVINSLATAQTIALEVDEIIRKANAIPDKIYVAFVNDSFIINN